MLSTCLTPLHSSLISDLRWGREVGNVSYLTAQASPVLTYYIFVFKSSECVNIVETFAFDFFFYLTLCIEVLFPIVLGLNGHAALVLMEFMLFYTTIL